MAKVKSKKTKAIIEQKILTSTKLSLAAIVISSLSLIAVFSMMFNAGLVSITVKQRATPGLNYKSVKKMPPADKMFLDSSSKLAASGQTDIKSIINSSGSSWTATDNRISRLTEDKKEKLLGIEITQNEIDSAQQRTKSLSISPVEDLPEIFDWRDRHGGQNYITSVKDQGSCGSCWAFALTGMMEGTYKAHYNTPYQNIDLAEQDFISCINPAGCLGVNTGELIQIMNSITGNLPGVKNITTEDCLAYKACDAEGYGDCSDGAVACSLADVCRIDNEYRYNSFRQLPLGDVRAIKEALIEDGPVMAGMLVYDDFLYYSSGIYQYSGGYILGGHAVLIVGYGTYDGLDYWIVKNSWGSYWGEGGYFRILIGDDSSLESLFLYTLSDPITPDEENVMCEDNDQDGYCVWGVGNMPGDCPKCDLTIQDCDDSDAVTFSDCGQNPDAIGGVVINSNPSNAQIYIKDLESGNWIYRGRSPKQLNLNIGSREIKISKVGYFDYTGSIKIEEEIVSDFSANLKHDPIYQAGWPVELNYPISWSSATAGDVDNDGKLEVAILSSESEGNNGNAYLINDDGSLLFTSQDNNFLHTSSPVLADLNSDGFLEVVYSTNMNIFARKYNGDILWLSDDFLYDEYAGPWMSPVVADIDKDGYLETIYSTTKRLRVLDHNGNTKFITEYPNNEWTQAAPVVADIDKDGFLEIIIGVQYSGYPNNYAKIYVYEHDGNIKTGWPYELYNGEYWIKAPSIAVGDIDADGDLDIVASSHSRIVAMDAMTQETLGSNWPLDLSVFGSYFGSWTVSLADLNKDGKLEIIIPGDYKILVFDYLGNLLPGWPVDIDSSGVSVADVNGDGMADIIGGDWYNGVYAWDINGSILPGFPLATPDGSIGSPLIVDLDNDGDVEIIAGDVDGNVHAWDLSSVYNKETSLWPMYQHDIYNTGLYNQQCFDGTLEGWCSADKPGHCINNQLVSNCKKCSCSKIEICLPDGECLQNIDINPHEEPVDL